MNSRSPAGALERSRAGERADRDDARDVVWRELDPSWMMQRVADQIQDLIEPADSVLIGLVDSPQTFRFVVGAGRLEGHAGFTMPIDGSLSGKAIASCEVLVSQDSFADTRANPSAVRRFDTRSVVAVPLVREGRAIGVLDVSSAEPMVFRTDDVAILREMASFVSAVVGTVQELERVASSLISVERRLAETTAEGTVPDFRRRQFVSSVLGPRGILLSDARGRLEELLVTRELRMVYQPVVDLKNGNLISVEALARFDLEPQRPPDQWFALARHLGLGDELELLAIERAIQTQESLGHSVLLAVNGSPAVICNEGFIDVVRTGRPTRLIVEITEHESVTSYHALAESLRRTRLLGVRFAVDDTGSGISSLAHVLRLAPEYIKFDRELTIGIESDPARQALADALARFARQTHVRIVAEGIETKEQLDILREIGIDEGQGFYFSPGVPAEELQLRYPLTR